MATELPPDDNLSVSDSDSANPPLDVDRDPFEELASEFAERQRNGEFPSVEDYAKAHPDLAEEIRDLFPTIAAMEQLKDRKAPTPKPTLGGLPLEQLGDFRILGEIGRGGMGVVYEAEQVSLGRRVAVKVLPKQALLDERHLRRFEREAQTAAKLHHTNIVPVFGVGQQDGYHYIVMQFIPGVGLDEVLIALRAMILDDDSRQFRTDSSSRASHASHNARALLEGNFSRPQSGGFSSFHKADKTSTLDIAAAAATATVVMDSANVSTTVESEVSESKPLDLDASQQLSLMDGEFYQSIARIGHQVADALAYAHEQGTLHRDIKPGNLLLDGTGTVWVADFGLAKLAEHDNVSRTGDLVGTLSYMPPESFSGETDGRGDVYALGLTLFEMLALRPAFFGRDRGKLVKQITEGDLPRLGRLNPSIPRDLETIVLKAVAHRPQDRYRTARELEEDLQRYLDDMPILARRMSAPEQFVRWCRKNKLVASLAASVLTLLFVTAGVITYSAEQRANKQAELAQAKAEQVEAEKQRAEVEKERAEEQKKRADEQQELRKEADDARLHARETTNIALHALMVTVERLIPQRLPLSANESLQITESEDALSTTAELEAEESAATVAPPPITAETAASLAVVLETFDRLAKRAGNDELGLIFAELTLRIGNLHKMLGNNNEALANFDDAISLFEAAKSKDPQTAIIGLAMSYNERGDVLANNRNRDDSLDSYSKAIALFKENDALLASSTRAQYEKARTLFLMSVQRSRSAFTRGRRGGPGREGPSGGFGERPSGRGGGPGREGPNGGFGGHPGGRGGGGRPAGQRPGSEMARDLRERISGKGYLQEAIAILENLTEREPDPEYTYLLARCYTGLSIAYSFPWERGEREESIQKAMSILRNLVRENPHVADYKFELAFAQLRSLDLLRRNGSVEVAAEIVDTIAEIATRNPGVWNYTILHAMALKKHAEILDGYADRLARKDDPQTAKHRIDAMQVADRAAVVIDQAYSRFPEQLDAVRGLEEFPLFRAGVQAKAGNHTQAVELYRQILADGESRDDLEKKKRLHPRDFHTRTGLASSLQAIGEEEEAKALLLPMRDELKDVLRADAAEYDRNRFGNRLYESLKMAARVEHLTSGTEAAKRLIEETRKRCAETIQTKNDREPTPIELGDFNLHVARCLREMGDTAAATELLDSIQADMEVIRGELPMERIREGSNEQRREQGMQRYLATRLLAFVYIEKQDHAAVQELFKELPRFPFSRGGPWGGRGRGEGEGRGRRGGGERPFRPEGGPPPEPRAGR